MATRSTESREFLFRLLESCLVPRDDQSGDTREVSWKELIALTAIVIVVALFVVWLAGSH